MLLVEEAWGHRSSTPDALSAHQPCSVDMRVGLSAAHMFRVFICSQASLVSQGVLAPAPGAQSPCVVFEVTGWACMLLTCNAAAVQGALCMAARLHAILNFILCPPVLRCCCWSACSAFDM
jgi:hypothetical protein